jgi:predicted DNA-binding transcriptional regulator AlpA
MKDLAEITKTNRLLLPEELAKFLNVRVSWVTNHASPSAKNPLPVKRVGRLLRFDINEVLEWLNKHGGRENGE